MAKKVCAYCRVSTTKPEQLKGIDYQEIMFIDELKEKPEYEVVKTYTEIGRSGTKLERPEFDKLLYDAGINIIESYANPKDRRLSKKHRNYEIADDREPLFEEIWMKNTSRFARNTLSYEIIQILRRRGVNIYFKEQNIHTKDTTQDMILKMMQIFDENDSKDKSLKVTDSIHKGIELGVIHTSGQIYGYQYLKDTNTLKIIPDEAANIKLIYDLYLQGYGYRRIVNTLTEKGINTRKGIPFVESTIQRILKNEKYAGLNNALKYDYGKVFERHTYPKIREGYERNIKPSDKIPLIISKDSFYKCQEILYSKTSYVNQKGIYYGVSKYMSKIYCTNCGSIYYSQNDGGRKFYRCKTKHNRGKEHCNNPNVSEKAIDEYVERKRLHYRQHKENNRSYFLIMIEIQKLYLINKLNKDNIKEVEYIDIELNKRTKAVDQLLELVEIGDAVNNVIKTRLKKLSDEIETFQEDKRKLLVTDRELLKTIKKLEELEEKVKAEEYKQEYTTDEVLNEVYLKIKSDNKGKAKIFITDKVEEEVSKYLIVGETEMDIVNKDRLYEDRDELYTKLLVIRKSLNE